ncbi:putative uncharacterized protein [Firmicutes bacterium CAG:194]|nr:putative uncharacterized protein [Firmicutes bacterium CAG:194]
MLSDLVEKRDEKIKVSIITVTYNVEKTIEQTINSVLNQTYNNIEYIIVDGMSTDGTWEKICMYKDKISVLIHEKDNGLYDAMNKGISQATGDIIGIVNGDDWYEPNAVQTIVQNIENNIDIYYARMNIIDNDGNVLMVSLPDQIDDIWYRMIPHPTVFVRKSVYEKYGAFDLNYSIVADYEMIFRFYLLGVKFRYIDRVITNFRQGGLTTKRQLACAQEVKKVSMKYLDRSPDAKREEYLQLIKNNYNRIKLLSAYQQDNTKFKEMLCRIFNNNLENVCIFGAGIWGKRCVEKLKQCNVTGRCYFDNNADRQGLIIDGLEVLSPSCLKEMECNIIIAVINGYREIEKQLSVIHNDKLKWIRMFDLYDEENP